MVKDSLPISAVVVWCVTLVQTWKLFNISHTSDSAQIQETGFKRKFPHFIIEAEFRDMVI